MMRRTVFVISAACLCLALTAGVARSEERKKSEKLPTAVAQAVKTKFPKGEVVGVEKGDEDGETVYEVELRYAQGRLEATFTPKGQVVKVEMKGGKTKGEEDEHE